MKKTVTIKEPLFGDFSIVVDSDQFTLYRKTTMMGYYTKLSNCLTQLAKYLTNDSLDGKVVSFSEYIEEYKMLLGKIEALIEI